MKSTVLLFVLMSGVLLGRMHAATTTKGQPAIVISVEAHDPQSNSNYAVSLDFPLQPQIYFYNIVIRVGSTIYRTNYASAFDYLPSVFAANHPIQVNLGHRLMDVTLPGDRVMRLAIESHSGL